jgi:hypothetical protein
MRNRFPRSAFFSLLLFSALSAFSATVTIGTNKEVLIDGKPFFPIVTWLQNASLIAMEKSYGFNTFVGQGDNSTALAYCNEAQKQGVYAVPLWNGYEVASVKTHAALLGWVFGDEPDLQSNKVPPSFIRLQYDSIKAADPDHITFLTVTSGFYGGDGLPAWMNGSDSMYYSYPKYTDLIGFDYYPVYGWCRPDWIYKVGGGQDELVNKYCKETRSTYQWIECVKTSSQWCDLSSRGDNDGPYDYEINDEVWLAIVKGANGIGYFTHSWECPGYTQCCLSDVQIALLKKINARISALTNVLCAVDSKVAITVQSNDPKGSIVFRAKEYEGSLYLIAVDVIGIAGALDTQQVTLTVPGLQGSVQAYDENRTITPAGTAFSDRFIKTDPVHIYVMTTSASVIQKKNRRAASLSPRIKHADNGMSVQFLLPDASGNHIRIYSCSGALINTLQANGRAVRWDFTDRTGVKVGAGVYYAVIAGISGVIVLPVVVKN